MTYDKNSYLNIHVIAENYYYQLMAKTLSVNEIPVFFDEQDQHSKKSWQVFLAEAEKANQEIPKFG